MKPKWLALLAVALPLAVLVPLEKAIHQERVLLKYGGAQVTLAMRDRLGQGAAIALLAGFRGVVADFLWIQNQGFWENREWIRMYRNMELVTTLQPQSTTFWDLAEWHMAWNISYAVLTDPANHTKAEGLKRQQEWLAKARDFLAEGLRNIPNHPDLYFSMGTLYLRKFHDPCTAAEYFRQAAQFPDAPSYADRMCARALEHCGRVQAAYDYWKTLWRQHRRYDDHIDNSPLIERELRRLEILLKIPNDERTFPVPAAPVTKIPGMKYAILSDIHANLEALQAVLADARQQQCTHYVCLGDVVGYGPNPHECLDMVRNLECATIMGNHDEYCATEGQLTGFNPMAADAIKWTRAQLQPEERDWLRGLKYIRNIDPFTIVHATLDLPERWAYVFDNLAAAASFNYQHTAVCFNGHTHIPIAFIRGERGIQGGLYSRIRIEVARKYFINVGSVGQPRDRNPKPAYVIFDLSGNLIELRRVEYDIPAVQKKIRAAGLPESLAQRLEQGR